MCSLSATTPPFQVALTMGMDHTGYSPELNPAEYLNNHTKHAILAKQRPADQERTLSQAGFRGVLVWWFPSS